MQVTQDLERLLTTEETAKLLGKSPAWLRTARSVLGIPSYRVGKHYRYKFSEVQKWLINSSN